MADDKNGRESQARAEENRQRRRAVLEELERWDETEPTVDDAALAPVDEALAEVNYPATGTEVVAAAGDVVVESPEGTYTVADLVPETDDETFDSPAAVRERVRRPTVAASMKRIVEAKSGQNRDRFGSQRDAYEKTLRALAAIDADDDDEGVTVVTDWIVARVSEGKQPSSRQVRKRAAQFCRENGYPVRDDGWLGA